MDLHRARLAEPVEPPDALLERERGVGEVEADEVARELEVAPLAARLAGEEQHRTLGVAEAGHQPVTGLERLGVVVEEGLEPLRRGDAGLQFPQPIHVAAEDEHLLPAAGEPAAEGRGGVDLLALPHVLAAEGAAREGAHLDAPVADEARGEAVAAGEVLEQCGPGGPLLLPGGRVEGFVVGGELAKPDERVLDLAAGEEVAGHGRVGLVRLEPVEEGLQARGGDGLHEREEPEVLLRVEPHGRGGEEQQAERVPGHRGDRVEEPVLVEVVGLVDDDEVPVLRRRGARHARVGGEEFVGEDGEAGLGEGRLGAAGLGDAVPAEQAEEGVELVEELRHPLEGEVLGHDHQHALGEAQLAQAGEDEAGLDGLAETHLVGEDEARGAVGEDAAGGAHLVREDVDAGGEERAQAVGAAQGLEPGHPGAQREGRGGAGVAGGEPVEEAAGGAIERGVVGDEHERPVTAGDDRHPLAAGEAHGEPASVVAHLEHEPDSPRGLGPVDELLSLLPRHSAGALPVPRA